MNILLITTHLNAGGITSYLLILTRGLIREGHSVTIASSGGELEDAFRNEGITLIKLDINTKSELSPRLWKALPKVMRLIKNEGIDIIHSHTRVSQVLGCVAGKLSGRPYIATCHGFFKPRWGRRLLRCWGDRTIAISKAVKEHLISDFKVRPERIAEILTGIELEKFRTVSQQQRIEKRQSFGIKADLLIGMIARLSDVKGQDVIIKAMPEVIKEHPGVKLALIGEGKMEGELRSLVNELKLNGNVMFYPTVGQTVELLHMMDIVVSPSRMEGLGISVMEAQACGVPVVASKVGGLVSLIENEMTGILVEPEDPHQMAQALKRLIIDQNLRSSIGIAARKKAEVQYGAAGMTGKIISLYKELIDHRER